MQLKVLSWNIWSDGDMNQVKHFMEAHRVDIIALQEVKDDDPQRNIIGYLKSLGYYDAFAPAEKIWNGRTYRDGPAIFTRQEIIKIERYSLSSKDNRMAIRTDIKFNNKILHAFSTHLTHTHQKETEIQNGQVKELIKLLPKKNTIVAGDFNATPQSTVIKLMNEVLVDADPKRLPTWSLYPEGCIACNPKKIDTRLDYIFVTPDLKVISFEVLDSKASDHLPILATIEV